VKRLRTNTDGPTTNRKKRSATASTMLVFDKYWMPRCTPLAAETMNAMVSKTMMPTANDVDFGISYNWLSPELICRAPSPSDVADPNRVAKIAKVSMARPAPPSDRLPNKGKKAELIRLARP
jgi:hypothetical protein